MSTTVLVTGASGFIGREVVRLLSKNNASSEAVAAVAFSRTAGPDLPGIKTITGNLLNADDLGRGLRGVASVIHLAAATGKASDPEMERVNVDGTRMLVDACVRTGVTRLIHVSTIAVTYADLTDYPYGRSKRAAERVVTESELAWTVVRPTIVLGPASPALGPLRSLAAGPLLLLPGGGRAQVQPVDVRDVASSLVALALASGADADRVARRTVEMGGPERLSMRALLTRVRTHTGKGEGPTLPIPLALLRGVAGIATGLLGSRSPVTPGQLSAFRFDSLADLSNAGLLSPPKYDISAMLDGV